MIKVLLMALSLSLSVSAMQGQDQEQCQQTKPCKKIEKCRTDKVKFCKNLGVCEIRKRHHEERTWITTTTKNKKLRTETFCTGENCVEECPIEKTVPCEQQEDKWQDQVGQDNKQQSCFKSDVSKKQRPIRCEKKVCRKFLGEVIDEFEREETVLETVEWDSCSGEEIPGDECQKPICKEPKDECQKPVCKEPKDECQKPVCKEPKDDCKKPIDDCKSQKVDKFPKIQKPGNK